MFSLKYLSSLGSKRVNLIIYPKIQWKPMSLSLKKRSQKSNTYEDSENNFLGYSLLLIPAFTFYLGTWQVKRRKWKLGILDEIRNKFNLEPRELPTDLGDLKNLEYVPIKVKGTYLHDKELIVGPRSLISDNLGQGEKNKSSMSAPSQRGFLVITPFKLEDRDLTILINRGWVPEHYKSPSRRPSSQTKGVQEITGILRLSEKKPTFVPENKLSENMLYYRNIEEIANFLNADPVYLDLKFDNKQAENIIISGQTRISLRNEHLSYAITWYSLSVTTGYLWYRLFFKKLPLF